MLPEALDAVSYGWKAKATQQTITGRRLGCLTALSAVPPTRCAQVKAGAAASGFAIFGGGAEART